MGEQLYRNQLYITDGRAQSRYADFLHCRSPDVENPVSFGRHGKPGRPNELTGAD